MTVISRPLGEIRAARPAPKGSLLLRLFHTADRLLGAHVFDPATGGVIQVT